MKQLGVDHVIAGPPGRIPWKEAQLKELIDRLKGYGLTRGEHHDQRIPQHSLWQARPRRRDRESHPRRSARPARWACRSSNTTSMLTG